MTPQQKLPYDKRTPIFHWIDRSKGRPACGVLGGYYKQPEIAKEWAQVTCERCLKYLKWGK